MKQQIENLFIISCCLLFPMSIFLPIKNPTVLEIKKIKSESKPYEKIYSQTDRSLYYPGESIWFKAYTVDLENRPSPVSELLNAELIAPNGSVLKTKKLYIKDGAASGEFKIDKKFIGGIYKIKMYTRWMENFGKENYFNKDITIQKVIQPRILQQLDFAKKSYGPKSEVFADYKIKDLHNDPITNQVVNYTVFIKGKKLISRKVKTNAEGKLQIHFKLPRSLKSADALLNVMVDYKGNVESISRSIPILVDNIDLQLMPESGPFIANTKNVVAFKAIDEFGKPADVNGLILDENFNEVGQFNSYHDGMGTFELNPKFGKKYYAQIKYPIVSDSLYQLPLSLNDGIRFTIDKKNKNTLNIYTSEDRDVWIEASNAAKILEQRKIRLLKGMNFYSFKIDQAHAGMIKYRLKDLADQPLAERLVFMNYDKHLNIEIILEKEKYSLREKITAKIKTKDLNGKPIPANLSLSVADNKLVQFADDKQDDIESYLLMSADLNGKIYKPNFYFDTDEPKSKDALDLVMLTHGWRNYIQNPSPNEFAIKPEQLNIYKGQTALPDGSKSKAKIVVFENNTGRAMQFDTDKDGQFYFKMTPKEYYSILAYRKDGQQLYLRNKTVRQFRGTRQIVTEDSAPIAVVETDKHVVVREFEPGVTEEDLDLEMVAAIPEFKMEENVSLDEIIVVGYSAPSIRYDRTSSVSVVASELRGKVSGVSKRRKNQIKLRGISTVSGVNNALYVIDGIPIRDMGAFASNNINPNDIASVEVLKNDDATLLYGAAASNGAVVINTKRGRKAIGNYRSINVANYQNYAINHFYNDIKYSGISNTASFYSPVYITSKTDKRTDFRKTLYWNPVVQTDEHGEANLTFYSSDEISSFIIKAEGVTGEGLVGKAEKLFSTTKGLSLDFKAPKFLTINDTVSLNVIINNDLPQDEIINLKINQCGKFTVLKNAQLNDIKVKRSGFTNVEIPMVAKDLISDCAINIEIASGNFGDAMEKQIDIISPYFRSSFTIANNKAVNQQFKIGGIVEGSMDAALHVYTSSLATTMDGIEGMLGAPHGCFEQTSSSTYPNVLALQFLRETGTSNPAIEKKALEYIKLGHDRLMSFESEHGGFEWYGGNPASETLTAYGLLEFTDMKKVYPAVSDEMIKRTVKWILSRRDGNGGFKSGRLFSACSQDIANAYIIYALSAAKLNVDIEKEYLVAYNDALNSKDVYKMALMALSSHNLNKFKKRDLLNNLLIAEIEDKGFEKVGIVGSMTGSYYNNVKVETASLIVMSLLKVEQVNNTVLDGVNFILKSKKGYRFGSTQATCLALQALLEYAKLENANNFASTDSVLLNVNGYKFSKPISYADQGKIVFEDLGDYLNEGIQKIDISFNNLKVNIPYAFHANWQTYHPNSQAECALQLSTQLLKSKATISETVRMEIKMKNNENETMASPIAIIGIPSGTAVQPWQLKELVEKEAIAFYELHDNELVLYWRKIEGNETIAINLDLKAELAGKYRASASRAYLYYGDEYKHWVAGSEIDIKM